MWHHLLIAIGIIISLALAGCGQLNTAFRTYDNENQSVMVDVKQRAIIAGYGSICAEPSPDAMAAYAAEIAASVKTPQQISGQLAASGQEGAAYVGLRTQSIQLLRDSLYRLCEGFMNGAISGDRFDLLARRYQKNMVALLAIEQLTGTVKAPPVTINTQSLASAAQAIEQLLESQKRLLSQRDSITKEITDLDTNIASYDAALKQSPPPPQKELDAINDKKASAVKRRDSLKISLNSTETALKLHDEAIKNPSGSVASGSTSSQILFDPSSARSSEAVKQVADTVKEIVTNIIQGNEAEQMCLDILQRRYLSGTYSSLSNLSEDESPRFRKADKSPRSIMETDEQYTARQKKAEEQYEARQKKAEESADKLQEYCMNILNKDKEKQLPSVTKKE